MSEAKKIEDAIKDLELAVSYRQMALKLRDNHEFRKLFVEEYWTKDAARMVQMSCDPELSQSARDEALKEAHATGYMKRHLNVMIKLGDQAEAALPEYRQALEQARYFDVHGKLPDDPESDGEGEDDGAGY